MNPQLAGKSIRIQRTFTTVVSLFAPDAVASAMSGFGGSADFAYNPTPAFKNVPCRYHGIAEADEVAGLLLSKENSLLVFTKWKFLISQQIADGWLIVVTADEGNPYLAGNCYVCRSNPVPLASARSRPVGEARVFALIAPTSIVPTS